MWRIQTSIMLLIYSSLLASHSNSLPTATRDKRISIVMHEPIAQYSTYEILYMNVSICFLWTKT